MSTIELKVSRIGNSRGVRLPATVLRRYQIGSSVFMEELSDGILLRPTRAAPPKLSFEETAREIAAAVEEWSGWDPTLGDGLEQITWGAPGKLRVAETPSEYRVPKKRARR